MKKIDPKLTLAAGVLLLAAAALTLLFGDNSTLGIIWLLLGVSILSITATAKQKEKEDKKDDPEK